VVLIATIAAQLGVEIDAAEELEAATAEAEKRAEKDTFQEPAADPPLKPGEQAPKPPQDDPAPPAT
jgi:hypothetical protein